MTKLRCFVEQVSCLSSVSVFHGSIWRLSCHIRFEQWIHDAYACERVAAKENTYLLERVLRRVTVHKEINHLGLSSLFLLSTRRWEKEWKVLCSLSEKLHKVVCKYPINLTERNCWKKKVLSMDHSRQFALCTIKNWIELCQSTWSLSYDHRSSFVFSALQSLRH